MQNKEADEVYGKKVNYCLFLMKKTDEKVDYLKFTETSVPNSYVILWYDAKMQNYSNLNEFLQKRKLVQAKI
jgi:hypothetical protein